MKKLISLILLCCMMLSVFAGCSTDDPEDTTSTEDTTTTTTKNNDPNNHTVTLSVSQHITVTSDATVVVEDGADAVFEMTVDDGYVLSSVSHGTYENGRLTVTNVTSDLTVTAEAISASTPQVTVNVGGSNVTVSGAASKTVAVGSTVTFEVSAAKGYYIKAVSAGTYDYMTGIITLTNVQANTTVQCSVSKSAIIYHLNDGTAKTLTQEADLSFYQAPNTYYLGQSTTLSRGGYALVEYNTEADGTGEGVSAGSKVTLINGVRHLYCIWMKETSSSDFAFENNRVTIKTGSSSSTGYVLSEYKGNAETVVIPEKYNGYPVVKISAGAFMDCTNMKTLVMPKSLREVDSGAFTGCAALQTLYFPDAVYSIPDDAFDEDTYSSLVHFYLNAAMAPRDTYTFDGMYRTKWDAVISSQKKRVVIISGSSSLWAISSEYFEKLLGDEYDVINFGTVRTTNATLYLEAMQGVLNEDDIVIFAPETSSIWQMGSDSLATSKMFRDTEGMYNVYRNVDISHFSGYFSGITEYNQTRYTREGSDYLGYNTPSEKTGAKFTLSYPAKGSYVNYSGDLISSGKNSTSNNTSSKTVSYDEYTYSLADTKGGARIDDTAARVAAIIDQVENRSGATVYFGFCPVSRNALTADAKNAAQQAAYDGMIAELFEVEILGSCSGHTLDNSYFYNSDTHHMTDRGRVKHTYQMYLDLCEALGINNPKPQTGHGSIAGCNFS